MIGLSAPAKRRPLLVNLKWNYRYNVPSPLVFINKMLKIRG